MPLCRVWVSIRLLIEVTQSTVPQSSLCAYAGGKPAIRKINLAVLPQLLINLPFPIPDFQDISLDSQRGGVI